MNTVHNLWITQVALERGFLVRFLHSTIGIMILYISNRTKGAAHTCPFCMGETMLKRICDICGRTVAQGKPCPCRASRHRAYDRERRDKNKAAFYNGKAWQRITEAARRRAQYADEVVFAETGRLIPGAIVHHIEPIDENPARKLDMENLIFVSAQTHKKIHDAYDKNPRAKREMQEKLATIRGKSGAAGAGQKSFEQEI